MHTKDGNSAGTNEKVTN